MAFQFDTNIQPATYAEAIFHWRELLKSVGWEIQSSSDGTTFGLVPGNAFDVITSFASGAGGLDNDYAWFVIKHPTRSNQFCFQRGKDSQHWQIRYSVLAPGFTAGSPNAITPPTAADQKVLAGAFAPPDSWRQGATMATVREQFAWGVLNDGRIIVAGGTGNGFSPPLSSVEIYDPVANTWTTVAPMSVERFSAGFTVLPDGRFLVAGGQDLALAPLASAEIYDPAFDSWSAAGTMSLARVCAWPMNGCSVITAGPDTGNVIFIKSLDIGNSSEQSSEIYNVGSNTWGSVAVSPPPFTQAGYQSAPCVLADGRIFLYNSLDTGTNVGCSMWDPTTNTWSNIANIPAASSNSLAVQLTSGPNAGRVLVVSCRDEFLSVVNTTQIYDPVGNTWAAGPSLIEGRYTAGFGYMTDGRLIIAGGQNQFGFALSNSEILDQSTMTWSQGPLLVWSRTLLVSAPTPNSYLGATRTVMLGSANDSISFFYGETELLAEGERFALIPRYPDGSYSYSVCADDAEPHGWWAGGYGLFVPAWFRAGGVGSALGSPTWGSYSLMPDALAHAPAARSNHAMAYNRDTWDTVMFGGLDEFSQLNGETWVWNGDYWRNVTLATDQTPAARQDHAMEFDNVRKKTIMFGGLYGGTPKNETWSFNGTRWTLLNPATSPAARLNHSMVWSPTLGAIVLFGGNDLSVKYHDTWSWDGTTWTLLHSGAGLAPAVRTNAALAIDPVNGKVLLFGGSGTGVFGAEYNDTWQFDTSTNTWANVTPANDANNVAQSHTSIAVGSNGAVLPQAIINLNNVVQPAPNDENVLGLVSPVKVVSSTGTQTVTFTNKIAKTLTGCAGGGGTLATNNRVFNLGGRYRHSMVLDVLNARVVLFGGYSDQPGYKGDTWLWNGTTWTMAQSGIQASRCPGKRADTAMVYDFQRVTVVMWGGLSFGSDNEPGGVGAGTSGTWATWLWNGTNWTRRRSAPYSYGGSKMAYDSFRNRIVWFGGAIQIPASPLLLTNHTWELDGSAGGGLEPRWEPAYAVNAPLRNGVTQWPQHLFPVPRQNHVMTFDPVNNVILVYGGRNVSNTLLSDTWKYDGTTWTQLLPGTIPAARDFAAIAYDVANSKAIMYGGSAGGTQTYAWNGANWTLLAPVHNPGTRSHHCMAYHPGVGVVLFGDIFGSSFETWVWDGVDWEQVNTPNPPYPIKDGVMVYDAARARTLLMGYSGGYVFAFDGNDWVRDDQVFSQYDNPRPKNSTFPACGAFDSANNRTHYYSGTTNWYSGLFNAQDSGFMFFDPIKDPLPEDPDPFVVGVTQKYSDPYLGGLQEMFPYNTYPASWATFGTLNLPFDVNGLRFQHVQGSNLGETAHRDPALGGNRVFLVPVIWSTPVDNAGVKGESSLFFVPTHTFGYGGTLISTLGEASQDLLGIKFGLYGPSLVVPWDGSAALFSTDKNGPGSGNTEAYSNDTSPYLDFPVFSLNNNLKGPVEAVNGVRLTRGDSQSSVILDPIDAQEPLLPPGEGGGPVYRMRAYDSTLGRVVFWNAPIVDLGGGSYVGPGPLVDIVVQLVIGC